MAIKINPTSIKKALTSKPATYASRAIGIASALAVVYDAHVNGKEKAKNTDYIDTSDRFYDQYKQYRTSEKESATICKFKKVWYEIQKDFPLYHIFSKTKGYFSGFGMTLLKDLPVLALSAASIAFKQAGKVSSALLGLYGIKTVGYDVMGVGREKEKL